MYVRTFHGNKTRKNLLGDLDLPTYVHLLTANVPAIWLNTLYQSFFAECIKHSVFMKKYIDEVYDM